MLYYPDDTIQHAGVVLNGLAADHLYKGYPRGIAGDANRALLVQNLSAVTAACLVVRKSIWNEVGGMDEQKLPVAFNDLDFCLKVKRRGYRNLWTPFSELYHYESVSRGRDTTPAKRERFKNEMLCIQERWGDLLYNDPAWNPNLSLSGVCQRLAYPSRAVRPWLATD
jgi:GT2 family glycosyltransferase